VSNTDMPLIEQVPSSFIV